MQEQTIEEMAQYIGEKLGYTPPHFWQASADWINSIERKMMHRGYYIVGFARHPNAIITEVYKILKAEEV